MKDHYDFSKGKRGRVLPQAPEDADKVKINLRIDQDIYDGFIEMAEGSGGEVGYHRKPRRPEVTEPRLSKRAGPPCSPYFPGPVPVTIRRRRCTGFSCLRSSRRNSRISCITSISISSRTFR